MKHSLKEKLNTQRTNKTLIWQTLLVTIGGTLGLLIKALNAGTNPVEIFLIILGFFLIIFLFYLIASISSNIESLHKKLMEEE